MPEWLGWHWIAQNLVWQAMWSIVVALMMTTLCKQALNVLANSKQAIWFFVCSLLGVFALTILFGHGQVEAKPKLNVRIENFMWGEVIDPPNQLKSPVFIVVSIRNVGSMASIADSYKLILNVGGRAYTGKIEEVDKSEKN